MSPPSAAPPIELRDPMLRSFVSLAVVLHFLCVGFVYSANVNASRLQQRLATIFAPYTELLHLNPGGTRLQFTDGSPESDDHMVIVAPKLEDGTIDESRAIRLPNDERSFSAERRRLLTLTSDLGSYAQRDELAALFAKAIGQHVMREQRFDHVVVRVQHKAAQPLYDDQPTEERSTDFVAYEAEVWTDEDGIVQTQKRASGLGAAPTSQGAGS